MERVIITIIPSEVTPIPKWLDAIRDFINARPVPIDAWDAVKSSGWSSSYRCDLSTLKLRPELPLHDAAKEFLTHYGGLIVDGRSEMTLIPATCEDDLDYILAIRDSDGRDYYPVGRIDDECATCVLIDGSGKIFLYASPPGSEDPPWLTPDIESVVRFAIGRVWK